MADAYPVGSNFAVLDCDIPCFTEIKVVQDNQTQIYRGHPTYHGEDPWHDWVYVSWECEDGLLTKVPAEIQLFVDVNKELFPYAGNLPGYKGEGTYTQIQSMLEEPVPHGPSKLVLSWGIREQDIYHFQWVDTFLDPAFVIDNIGCPC